MKKTITNLFLPCFVLLFSIGTSQATTIIPFHDLGEMANASSLVVLATVGETFEVATPTQTYWHTAISIDFVSKGNVQTGTTIELEHFSTKGEGWVKVVPDDVQLTEGKSYLLFLTETNTGFWRPILMSYGIFEQYSPGTGDNYLVPLPEWADLNILNPSDGQPIEPLAVYRQEELLVHLRKTVLQSTDWNMQQALETTDVSSFLQAIGERTPPSHCTFLLSGSTGFRWLGFPGTAVNIRYPAAGDADCSPPTNANTYASTAAATMPGPYNGTNLVDGGTYSGFTPDCSDMTAVGDDFITFVNGLSGGYRNIVIQYNDPCNQITNLVSCAGTLAIGGLYGFTPTYMYDGATYYEGRYGYVIVNNGVCTCLSGANYTLVLTHEMTHSLGIGHIAGSGTANMNPSCCTGITSLDEQCLDYFYAPALPIELIDFVGKANPLSIELNWKTASELNNQHFEVERSRDGKEYEAIGTLPGAGNASEMKAYKFLDLEPFNGLNYYRLRQTDFDGRFTLSEVIAVLYSKNQRRFEAVVNPVTDGSLRMMLESEDEMLAEIQIIDQQGRILLTEKIQAKSGINYSEIPFQNIPSGIYLARLIMGKEVRVRRFVKS